MATFGEITYLVLDLMKEHTDDSYYTEEHIIFLASKMRALLLERKYKNSRNQTFSPMSSENIQEICIDLEPADMLPDGCSGDWLWSKQEIPDTMNVMEPKISTVSDMLHSMVTFIAPERMPYVGYNKWLKNILYASESQNKHLYIKGTGPQSMYLKQVKMSAVFSDPQKAAEMSCDPDANGKCNILEMEFPLEQALIPSCIELVAQELMGSRYAPEDKTNNAKDDFSEAKVTSPRHSRPVENSSYKPRQQEAEE